MGAQDIIQIISSTVVIISAIVAAIWTYYRFRKLREAKKSLTMMLIPKVYKFQKNNLVEVAIELTNTGTVPIFGKVPNNPECVVEAKALPIIDGNFPLMWSDDRLQKVIEPVEYLQDYDDPKEEIILEPGVTCEVKGYVVFSTSHKGLMLIRSTFVDNEDYMWVDYKIVDTRSNEHAKTTEDR